jgi:hypothetical protein
VAAGIINIGPASLTSVPACAAVPDRDAAFDPGRWRHPDGSPVADAEFAAARASCERRLTAAANADTTPSVGGIPGVNPIYRPGGEGLAQTPPSALELGIGGSSSGAALAGPPIFPRPRALQPTPAQISWCLEGGGLRPVEE